VLLLPAHDEHLVLGAALVSLKSLDYPTDLYRVVVIADNCSDNTAAIAAEHGAEVLERFNRELIGKGYALEWALERLMAEPEESFDAIVIMDADTKPAPSLLRSFDTGLRNGSLAMQARYEVLNADESWRTRLMAAALALAHIAKPLGRERLGLSDGLKGNGMCFARSVVKAVPWSGESITEDIEYALRLCRAGYRIAFLPDTAVWAQMPTNAAQATSQRKRWEGGRYRLLFSVGPRVLGEGLRTRNRLVVDRAIELIILPFAELFALPVLMLLLSAACGLAFHWHTVLMMCWAWIAVLVLEAVYLLIGLWIAKTPARIALSVLAAPFYIIWKFGVYATMMVTRSAGGWKRTERQEM
jgi:cellulose synthase/poly-beta-1,6-N-acetylglucosamine synthase-like glycosyltransferase